jgi:hypothetical protein
MFLAPVLGGCLIAPMARTDIAVIEGGDATIHRWYRTGLISRA